jgi:hypothetical protein
MVDRTAFDCKGDVAVLSTAVRLLARVLAPEIARELSKHMATNSRGEELCDRKSTPISKRAWDAYAGKPGGFPACRDGRRTVAKRADVLAWMERERQIRPTIAADEEQLDEDERALQAAGLRFERGSRR